MKHVTLLQLSQVDAIAALRFQMKTNIEAQFQL